MQQRSQSENLVRGITPDTIVDLRGLPMGQAALLTLRNALDRLAAGNVLEIRTSLGPERDDVKAWLRLGGHELVADLDADQHARLLARKRWTTRDSDADWGTHLSLREDGGFDVRRWFMGRFGAVPEEAPTYLGFVPRGAVAEPGGPDFPYALNRKVDVWADNLADLYEQAKTQQWDATTDIPWADLRPLPDNLERAVCQLMTFLAENEYAALYIPAKFIPRINAQYVEAVVFLSSVIADEARHIEVFMKRALANGGAPQHSAALTEWSLHSLLVQEDYFRSSFLLHVLGEGTFLDLLDFIERHAPDPVTAEVVRRARLDEGRHVAYGLAHVRYVLQQEPARAEELVSAAEERSELLKAASGANPATIEALATLAAGGDNHAEARNRGYAAVQALFNEMHDYRVRRMLQVGLQPATAERISQLHTPNFM